LRARAQAEAKNHAEWLSDRGVMLEDTPCGTKWELASGVDANKSTLPILA
jgi:hypothetical protein